MSEDPFRFLKDTDERLSKFFIEYWFECIKKEQEKELINMNKIKLNEELTEEQKKPFSILWKIADNINYGMGSTKKERKELSKELYEIHDDILRIIIEILKLQKKR